jgi:cytochrome c oxidase subunit 1/cytochrome c oxidase subunit I+III
MTGRMLSERLGKLSFWVMFIGFNITFFPMHILGFLGMPRRVYTYHDGLGWSGLNLMVSLGSGIFALGTGITLLNWWWSRKHGELAPADPWDADTLEWATESSPPPHYNFEVIPTVASRHPKWDGGVGDATEAYPDAPIMGAQGVLDRETPVTGGIDTAPQGKLVIPPDTPWPFLVAAGLFVAFVGLLVTGTLVILVGALVMVTAILWWTWHTEEDLR